MSNAFTNFISNLRASAESRPSLIGAEPQAKLIGVPLNVRDEVVNTRQPVRVKGEVIQSDNGTVRVRTDRGDVEFRPADGQRIPKEGQQIEIEIPPNTNAKKAPEIVNYRRLPDPAQTQQPQGRPSQTPVDVDVQPETRPVPRPQTPSLAQPPSQPASQPLPPEGADIRLQPLPPQTPLAPYEPLEQIGAQLTSVTPEQLLVIVQNAQSDLQETLATLQTPKTVMTAVQVPVLKLLDVVPPTPLFAGQKEIITQNVAPIAGEKISVPSQTAPEQKTLLENLFQGLPKLPVDILQKIAFGKTAPAIVTQSSTAGAFVPSTIPVKAQMMDVTLAGKLTPGIELKPQAGGVPITTENTPKVENMILENQKAGAVTGVVTNITQGKQPVVSVFFPSTGTEQMFTLPFVSEQITVGTHIQMMPQNTASPLPSAMPVSPGVIPLPVLLAPQPWPLMDEIYQSLAQASPQAAQAFSNIVPTPASPANMSPAILFFVAAVRGGDLSQWLGDKTIETLKSAGKSGLLSRLTQEGAGLNRIAADPVSPDWRAVNLPMFAQGEMQKISLYYRHEHEEGENDAGGKTLKGTRFVFDLKLDAMGKVQLDGLFRPVTDSGKRLDLVVRTEQFFSQATQAEMRRVYTRALHDTGVGGELSFQNRPETWVSVDSEGSTLTISS